ncbi:MAG: DUF4129 domain-containing protein [Candidatus Dormibacteria bacterium]
MSDGRHLRRPQALLVLGVVGVLAMVVVLTSRGGMVSYIAAGTRHVIIPLGKLGGKLEPSCSSSGPSICGQAGASGSVWWLALWLGLALGLILIVGSVVLFFVTRNSRSPQDEEPEMSEALPLEPRSPRRPSNPREAVLAAFGDLEDRLAAAGVGRLPTEGPDSYLRRALPARWRSSSAKSTLVRWYAVARYSEHAIDSQSATQAVDAATELARGTFGDRDRDAAPPSGP